MDVWALFPESIWFCWQERAGWPLIGCVGTYWAVPFKKSSRDFGVVIRKDGNPPTSVAPVIYTSPFLSSKTPGVTSTETEKVQRNIKFPLIRIAPISVRTLLHRTARVDSGTFRETLNKPPIHSLIE